jgi:hypothetical protein
MGEKGMPVIYFWESQKERKHVGRLIILKCILEE